MAKDGDYMRLISTARWRDLRRQKLTARPLCERCEAEGRLNFATEVHHITPVETGLSLRDKEALMFSYSNLQSLCHECHVRTHTEMGRGGRRRNEEAARARLDGFRRKFLEGFKDIKDIKDIDNSKTQRI